MNSSNTLGIILPDFATLECIAFTLIPEHALDLAAGLFHLSQHRAVQTVAPLLFLGRVPLLHAGSAVGTGHQIRPARRSTRPSPLRMASRGRLPWVRFLWACADRVARVRRVARMDRVRRIDQPVQGLFSNPPVAVHAKEHHSRIGRRHVDQVPDAFHFDCPASTQRSPTNTFVPGDRLDVLTRFDLAEDPVWSAGRHPEQFRLGLVESDLGVAPGLAPMLAVKTLPSFTDSASAIGSRLAVRISPVHPEIRPGSSSFAPRSGRPGCKTRLPRPYALADCAGCRELHARRPLLGQCGCFQRCQPKRRNEQQSQRRRESSSWFHGRNSPPKENTGIRLVSTAFIVQVTRGLRRDSNKVGRSNSGGYQITGGRREHASGENRNRSGSAY